MVATHQNYDNQSLVKVSIVVLLIIKKYPLLGSYLPISNFYNLKTRYMAS